VTTKYEITARGLSQTVHLKAETPEAAAVKAVKKFLGKHARKIVVREGKEAAAAKSYSVFDATAEEFSGTKALRLYVALHADEPEQPDERRYAIS
jgi:hypothetical protein